MADFEYTYKACMQAYRSTHDEGEQLGRYLDGVSKDFDLYEATDCVSIGTGSGDYDLTFVTRCMPHIRYFDAVDQDDSNADDLQHNLRKLLPGIQSTVHRTPVENWTGPRRPTDAVLMFHTLYYFSESQRDALFRRCFDDWLKPDGCIVVLIDARRNGNEVIPYREIIRWMNPKYQSPDADDIRSESKALGYRVEKEFEFEFRQDYSDPNDQHLQMYNYHVDEPVKLDRIRSIIKELIPEGCRKQCSKLLVVTEKPAAGEINRGT